MSDTNTTETAAAADENNQLEESTITMGEWLEQEKEMEEEYAAVLGASDEKACTYAKGAIQRQALYSCLTCCPEARTDVTKSAGICLACSYSCHEDHDLVELYTKRNFRCDCPTLRFGAEKRCLLNPQFDAAQAVNAGNLYNQNYQGLYCKCKRPYPDPDRTTEEVMFQCVICEDWHHLHHIDAPTGAEKWFDAGAEMTCDTCMERHTFLRDYSGLAMQQVENVNESDADTEVSVHVEDKQLKSKLDRSISDIMNVAEQNGATEAAASSNKTESNSADEPASKRPKLATDECRRPKPDKEFKGAIFWTNDWRKSLCRCVNCLAMYKEQAVEYLLDPEDSYKPYEERGMKRMEENYEQGITRALSTMGRTQQIDAIMAYNSLKDKLKDFLHSFAQNNQVVTEADINRFFAGMRNENNANVGQPYFCR